MSGRSTGTSELAGQAILTLTPGDTLSRKNVGNTALTFTPNAGGPNDNVAASIGLNRSDKRRTNTRIPLKG